MRAGYKLTEVGLIPGEWKVIPMGQLGTLTMGKGLLKDEIRLSGLIPAIPYTAIYTDFAEVLDYKDIKWFVNDEKSTHIASEPCVLIASSSNMEANTGKATALPDSRRVAIGREVIAYRTSCDASYVSYLLSTAAYRRKTLSVARGTTIKHVYPATFVDYHIAVPPAKEQRAIATALSDVDALLAKIDQLIAKKRDLKQAAMQQLLTGQTRLPGFSGDWEVKRLGEIFTITAGKTKSAYVVNGGKYWVVDMGSVSTTGKLIVTKATNFEGDFLRKGDLVMPKDDIGGGGIIGRVAHIDEDTKYVLGDHVYHLEAIRGIPLYLSYVINGHKTNSALRKKVIGSAQLGLGRKSVDDQEIPFPPTEEQTAIATVLSDMDAELAALKARRHKTRALKQGMMQALLTGRIRLAGED